MVILRELSFTPQCFQIQSILKTLFFVVPIQKTEYNLLSNRVLGFPKNTDVELK